jgi:hypothetical protein
MLKLLRLLLRNWLTVCVFGISLYYFHHNSCPPPLWEARTGPGFHNFVPFSDGYVRLYSRDPNPLIGQTVVRSWTYDGLEQSPISVPAKIGFGFDCQRTGTNLCRDDSKEEFTFWNMQDGLQLTIRNRALIESRPRSTMNLDGLAESSSVVTKHHVLEHHHSPSGRWAIIQTIDMLGIVDVEKCKVSCVLQKIPTVKAVRINDAGDRLLCTNEAGSMFFLFDPFANKIIANIPYSAISYGYDSTLDGKGFVFLTRSKSESSTVLVCWVRASDGEIIRQVPVPIPEHLLHFARVYCLTNDEVALFRRWTEPRFPGATELNAFLERKWKWTMPWINEAVGGGDFFRVKPDGVVEHQKFGPKVLFGRVSEDGQYYLINRMISSENINTGQFQYAVYRYPFPSRWPMVLLQAALAALACYALIQAVRALRVGHAVRASPRKVPFTSPQPGADGTN